MNSEDDVTPQPASLSREDENFYAHYAEQALSRRNRNSLQARRFYWFEWLLSGGIGLFGLLWLGWSSSDAALLLLITFWLGWLIDLLIQTTRSKGIEISLSRVADDMRFWQVVSIMRGKRKRAPDTHGHPSPILGLIVDLVAGTTASVLLVYGLRATGIEVIDVLKSPSLAISVALVAAFGIAPALHKRRMPADDGSISLPVFSVGQRGIGLLVVVFAFRAFGGGLLHAPLLMGGIYAFFVLMAAIELIWGVPAMQEEANWIRQHRA